MGTSSLERAIGLLPVLLVAMVSGCTNIDFREPVSSYNQGMALSGAVLSQYYSSLNDQARDTYIVSARYNEGMEILEDEDGAPTGLVALIPPEAIKARLDSIGLISQFGSKLAALAGSDAPERINTGVVTLGESYKNLASSFRDARGFGPSKTNPDYIAPVTTIIGELSKQYEDNKRDKLLGDAIKNGYPAVEAILLLIEKDIPIIHQWAVNNTSLQLSNATTYYNEKRATLSFEQRSALLSQISVYAKSYQDLSVNQPTNVVIAMREVNAELLAYANNPKDENRIVRLTSAIDTFNSRVQPIAEAILKMRAN